MGKNSELSRAKNSLSTKLRHLMDSVGNPSEEEILSHPLKYHRIQALRRERESLRAAVDPATPIKIKRLPIKRFLDTPSWYTLSRMPPLSHYPHKPEPFEIFDCQVTAWALQWPEVWDWIEDCAKKYPLEKRWSREQDRENETLWYWIFARLRAKGGPCVFLANNLWQGREYLQK